MSARLCYYRMLRPSDDGEDRPCGNYLSRDRALVDAEAWIREHGEEALRMQIALSSSRFDFGELADLRGLGIYPQGPRCRFEVRAQASEEPRVRVDAAEGRVAMSIRLEFREVEDRSVFESVVVDGKTFERRATETLVRRDWQSLHKYAYGGGGAEVVESLSVQIVERILEFKDGDEGMFKPR